MFFSVQLYILSEQRTSKESVVRSLNVKKKKNKIRSAQTQQVSVALTPGKGVLSLNENQHGRARKGGI